MSNSGTACHERLDPSAHEWLSGRLFAEASRACREYVDKNGLTALIPDLNLSLRSQELSETIADSLNFSRMPITAEMLSSKLNIRVEFKSIHSVNDCTWFGAEATVSGKVLRTEEKLVLDFGGPATVESPPESHSEGEESDEGFTQCGPTMLPEEAIRRTIRGSSALKRG